MKIIFTYGGKEYSGELSILLDAGDSGVYHLIVDKYYKGGISSKPPSKTHRLS